MIYRDGRLLPGAAAGLPEGEGLFETLRVDDGAARDLPAHLDRLLAGLARLKLAIPESRDALAAAAEAVAAEAPRPTARLRILVARSPRASSPSSTLVFAEPYEPPDEAAYQAGVPALLLAEPAVDSRSPLAGLKTLAREPYRRALALASAAGAWDALLLNERGRLVSGSRSNLVLVLPSGIFTPPLADGCLPGTVRQRLLEAGEIGERSLSPADLAVASEVLLLNSLVGVLPVGRLDGRRLKPPSSRPARPSPPRPSPRRPRRPSPSWPTAARLRRRLGWPRRSATAAAAGPRP